MTLHRPRRTLKLLWLALLFVALAAAATMARAQDQGDDNGGGNNPLRTVYGEVTNNADKPLHDAVVYLKNTRTLTVRTYISNQEGLYRFAGLDPNADYEIHAESDGLTSSNRIVSSFNSRKEIHLPLKVDKEKKSK